MGRERTTGSGVEAELAKSPGVEVHGKSLRIVFMYRGKRHRETLGLPITKANVKHAAQKRAAVLHAIKTGTFDYAQAFPDSKHAGQWPGSRSARLSELLPLYLPLKAVDITPDTEARYKHALQVTVDTLGPDRLASSLKPMDIQSLRAELIATRKPSTVNHYLATFAGMLEWCERNGYAPAGLATACARFDNTEEDPDPLTREEYQQLIEKGCLHEQDSAAITLMVYTGLRPGELCGLGVEDIDIKKGCLQVVRSVTSRGTFKVPKTTKSRTVLLLPPALKAAKTLIKLAESCPKESVEVALTRHQSRTDTITPLLSPKVQARKTKVNNWFVPTAWNTKWSNIQRRAGIRPRRPYQTRHTYACWCITAHGNLAFIANQMGHKDFTMLVKVYGKWMEDASEGEIQRIWQAMQLSAKSPNPAPQKSDNLSK